MHDVKAFLKSYIPAYKYSEKCFRELDAARDCTVRSPRMDGMPHTESVQGLDNQVARIDDIRRRAEAERDRVLQMREEIEVMIESLDDLEQRFVVKQRYIYGESWDEIAKDANMSRRTALYVHGRALTELRRKYEGHYHGEQN